MIYVTLFVMFFRIGLFSFGGGLAMLPLIFQSVKDFGMMTASEFSDLVALSQVTPGPIAVNAATYVGFNGAGIPGALAATLGVALPSFILILIVVQFLVNNGQLATDWLVLLALAVVAGLGVLIARRQWLLSREVIFSCEVRQRLPRHGSRWVPGVAR